MDDTGTFHGSNQSRRQRQNRETNLLRARIEREQRWFRLWLAISLASGCLIGAGLAWAVEAWPR